MSDLMLYNILISTYLCTYVFVFQCVSIFLVVVCNHCQNPPVQQPVWHQSHDNQHFSHEDD